MRTLIMLGSSHQFQPSILREYDIRGIVGETLFSADANALGQTFGMRVLSEGGGTVCVGWDGRDSSPALRDALVAGLTNVGMTVRKIGLGPTPMLNFALHHTKADAGIMVTGSHNPGTHNGFKMSFGPNCGGGRPVFGTEIQDIGRMAAAGIPVMSTPGSVEDIEVANAYIRRLIDELDGIDLQNMTIVWDCGNGASGDVVGQLVSRLSGTQYVLFAEIDGRFPNHHPDPTVATNLSDLQAEVTARSADLGIAFDGDGDRIGVVDDSGAILWADQLMIYYARDLLTEQPEAPLIADVKASQIFFEEVARLGGVPEMYRTGHSLIKNRMKEIGAPMAGEMSGHLFFNDRYYGFDDALYAAMRLLRIKAADPEPLSAFRRGLPVVFNTPEMRIDVDDERKFPVVDAIKATVVRSGADVNTIDGVRVRTDDGWWLLRASNTQAALVARCEALTESALAKQVEDLRAILANQGVALPTV
ncbi:MAG: phosphomannomutase/phosphoglucomutase [Rhodospirillaceae bacterium]|nr:phosphomannomutase/phosphoglucomutase [Rhodospirillaceae bacterium]